MTKHSTKCILRAPCRNADSPACSPLCHAYIAMHGTSGSGGRIGAAGIPKDYRNLTLATSPAREEQAKAYVNIRKYVDTFGRQFEADGERIKSLYLVSESPGTGKTTTAAAIANEYLIVHYIGSITRGRQPLQRPAIFLDINAWQTLYNGFTRHGVPADVAERHSTEYYRWESYAKSAPFVIFDDIGVRSASEAFRSDLHGVINHRVTNGMPAVYTSNIPMSELAGVFDARLADRIADQCLEIPFVGISKRGVR